MKYDISKAKKYFSQIIQSLLDGKEESIIISKNGIPVIKMAPIDKKINKRIGIAKKTTNGHDLSLEEFNSISTLDFGL